MSSNDAFFDNNFNTLIQDKRKKGCYIGYNNKGDDLQALNIPTTTNSNDVHFNATKKIDTTTLLMDESMLKKLLSPLQSPPVASNNTTTTINISSNVSQGSSTNSSANKGMNQFSANHNNLISNSQFLSNHPNKTNIVAAAYNHIFQDNDTEFKNNLLLSSSSSSSNHCIVNNPNNNQNNNTSGNNILCIPNTIQNHATNNISRNSNNTNNNNNNNNRSNDYTLNEIYSNSIKILNNNQTNTCNTLSQPNFNHIQLQPTPQYCQYNNSSSGGNVNNQPNPLSLNPQFSTSNNKYSYSNNDYHITDNQPRMHFKSPVAMAFSEDCVLSIEINLALVGSWVASNKEIFTNIYFQSFLKAWDTNVGLQIVSIKLADHSDNNGNARYYLKLIVPNEDHKNTYLYVDCPFNHPFLTLNHGWCSFISVPRLGINILHINDTIVRYITSPQISLTSNTNVNSPFMTNTVTQLSNNKSLNNEPMNNFLLHNTNSININDVNNYIRINSNHNPSRFNIHYNHYNANSFIHSNDLNHDSVGKRKKNQNPLKDQNQEKQKRPMNSFMIFAQEARLRLIKLNPGKDNRLISIILGREWKNLSPDEKARYKRMAQEISQNRMKENPLCWKRKTTYKRNFVTSKVDNKNLMQRNHPYNDHHNKHSNDNKNDFEDFHIGNKRQN